VPLSVGELGPRLTQCRLGEAPISVPSGILIVQSLGTTDIGRKLGAAVPFSIGVVGSPSKQSGLGRGLSPYQVAS